MGEEGLIQVTVQVPLGVWGAVRLESLERGVPLRDVVWERLRGSPLSQVGSGDEERVELVLRYETMRRVTEAAGLAGVTEDQILHRGLEALETVRAVVGVLRDRGEVE